MTEDERTTLYMWLVHEDFRLQRQLSELYDNFLCRKIDKDDLLKLVLMKQKIEDFQYFKQTLLYLLHLDN